MPQAEFVAWREFYRAYPFDDFHRIHRPAAVIARSAGARGTTDEILRWLAPDPSLADATDADISTMRAFGFKTKGT